MSGAWARVRALRWGFRILFGLPQPVKRLLAGAPVRLNGQVLDLDLQLLGRVSDLLASSAGGAVDQAALAEQRRQADIAAEVAAEPGLDDVLTRDLHVPGAVGPLPARLYVPPTAPETSALLVYFHGGGFVLGSLASTDPLCRLLAAQSGVRVLSVDYRLAPEDPYPAALEDAMVGYQGPGPRRPRSARTRTSSRSVATAPAPTSRWWWPTSRPLEAAPCRRSYSRSTPSPTPSAAAARASCSAPASG